MDGCILTLGEVIHTYTFVLHHVWTKLNDTLFKLLLLIKTVSLLEFMEHFAVGQLKLD